MVPTRGGELIELEDEESDTSVHPPLPREAVQEGPPEERPSTVAQNSGTRAVLRSDDATVGADPFDDALDLDFEDGDMLSAINDSFDAIVLPEGDGPHVPTPDRDPPPLGLESGAQIEEVRLLFSQICEGHAQPLLDFVCDLQAERGVDHTVRDVRAAARTLLRMANGVGMNALGKALDAFIIALDVFDDPTAERPLPQRKDDLIEAYQHLRGHLPDVFSAPASRDDRELLVVGALFSQLPAIGAVAIDKLFSAGLGKVRALAGAQAEELAAVTGLTESAAHAVVERFCAHQEELDAAPGSFIDGTRLERWIGELSSVTDAYEEARSSWSARSRIDRRVLRKLRTDAFAEVTIALVYMGELELVYSLSKLPFVEKVRTLRAFIEGW
jgi:hypothetical protein